MPQIKSRAKVGGEPDAWTRYQFLRAKLIYSISWMLRWGYIQTQRRYGNFSEDTRITSPKRSQQTGPGNKGIQAESTWSQSGFLYWNVRNAKEKAQRRETVSQEKIKARL